MFPFGILHVFLKHFLLKVSRCVLDIQCNQQLVNMVHNVHVGLEVIVYNMQFPTECLIADSVN